MKPRKMWKMIWRPPTNVWATEPSMTICRRLKKYCRLSTWSIENRIRKRKSKFNFSFRLSNIIGTRIVIIIIMGYSTSRFNDPIGKTSCVAHCRACSTCHEYGCRTRYFMLAAQVLNRWAAPTPDGSLLPVDIYIFIDRPK